MHYGLLAGCVGLFLSALLVWPIGWLVARRTAAPQPPLAGLALVAAGLTVGAVACTALVWR